MSSPSSSVTEQEITQGLEVLELNASSAVIVHSSPSSFGRVDGGAEAVCRALVAVCGTVLLPAGTWESHRFDELEERLRDATRAIWIGACRARVVGVREVVAAGAR